MHPAQVLDQFSRQVSVYGFLNILNICQDRFDIVLSQAHMRALPHATRQQYITIPNSSNHPVVTLPGLIVLPVTMSGMILLVMMLFTTLTETVPCAGFLPGYPAVLYGYNNVILSTSEMGRDVFFIIGDYCDFH